MKIETIDLKDYIAADYNPRLDLKPGDPDYERLKHSIDEFGFIEPLVVNVRTHHIVSGHQRVKILKEKGIAKAEAVIVDFDLEKEKAASIALNKIRGDWDENKLAVLFEELNRIPDFNIGITGFDLPEISEILDRAEEAKEDEFDLEKELDNIGKPVTQKGDLITLGEHRLLCGDSSKPQDIKRLIGDAKISLIFTDPPYNVNYYGGNRPVPNMRPKKSRDWERIYNDNLTQEEYEAWLKRILKNVTPYIAPGAPCYLWNGHAQFGPMHSMLAELGFHVSCVITWAKESFAIGYGDYNNQTEFCLYAWKKDNGAHHWYGPTNESSLWQIKRDRTATYNHPTQKPIALAHRAIKNSSKRGDVVLDVFLGSGTTLIAAEGLNRACFGVEIDPCYCDAIVRRYIACVGRNNISEELLNKYVKEESSAVK